MERALSSMPSGVRAVYTFMISSSLSIMELILALFRALHWAARWLTLLQLKHLHGGQFVHWFSLAYATLPWACLLCQFGAHAQLLMSIGIG